MSKKKPRPTPVPAEPIDGLIDAHTHLASCGARSAEEVDALAERCARLLDGGIFPAPSGLTPAVPWPLF